MTDKPHPKLQLFASATFPVQLATKVQYKSSRRLGFVAEVDPETGEVRLSVDPAELARLLDDR